MALGNPVRPGMDKRLVIFSGCCPAYALRQSLQPVVILGSLDTQQHRRTVSSIVIRLCHGQNTGFTTSRSQRRSTWMYLMQVLYVL
jgi:hypothetical protein